jgi:hypothetical protein
MMSRIMTDTCITQYRSVCNSNVFTYLSIHQSHNIIILHSINRLGYVVET